MDGGITSQFEQHIRAVTNLPFGSTELVKPSVMINLLGDIWAKTDNGYPDWASLLADPNVRLHLYDKGEARPGRKMGHFTVLGDEIEIALKEANAHFTALLDVQEREFI